MSDIHVQVQGGDYTHVLHGRYRDRKALAAFTAHPDYVNIVKKYLLPLTESMITLDWECKPYGPYLETIMAKRITLVKVKEGTPPEDMRFLEESIPRLPLKYTPNRKLNLCSLNLYLHMPKRIPSMKLVNLLSRRSLHR
jgi:hypothetical protein